MSTLPTGTVTFLFTDIEGSTLLWEQQPAAMTAAIARHNAILRAAIDGSGGQVFRTAGDAFCAAFATAAPAVAAAASAQQALFAERWPLDRPLRVRCALHTTEAMPRDGDYFSIGLNRLGRLLSGCHGGQTLLSQATEQLVRDHLPAETSLLDLGQHRLRDLTLPDRVFQLCIDGLPADFPPLRSLDAIPNNLPAQVTSFVGRERELRYVVEMLSQGGQDVRLLTLTGPGGTGKTRLSLQAAAALLDQFPDGVWFVELAPMSDPALVAQTIASALRLREAAGRPLDAMLADYLHDQHLLLVLDNCEHLIDECARITDKLLRACPAVHILTSSRESLGIAGDLEAALVLVGNLGFYWPQVASSLEGRRMIARALAQTEAHPDGWSDDNVEPRRQLLLAGAWFTDGYMATTGGVNPAIRTSMEKAIALLRPLGEIKQLAMAYGIAGLGALFTGDYETGVSYGREALALARQSGDRWGVAMTLITFSMIGAMAGPEGVDALGQWEEGMAIMRDLQDSWGEAMGHMVAGNAFLQRRDLSIAREHYEQSSRLFSDNDYGYMANIGRSGLAEIAWLQGDYNRALALYPQVIKVWRLADQRGAIARCLECLGFIAGIQAGDAAEQVPLLRRAATLYGAAESIRRANNSPMHPWEQAEYDGYLATLRDMLDQDEFASAWRTGQQMELDQAVAYVTR